MYDFTMKNQGLDIKTGGLVLEIFDSLFWFITLPLSYTAFIFFKSKGIQIYKPKDVPEKLTEDNFKRFKANIDSRKCMVIWSYHNFEVGGESFSMCDITQTKYNDYEWEFGVRGCGYISEDWERYEKRKEAWTLKAFQRFVHSFIEINEEPMTDWQRNRRENP